MPIYNNKYIFLHIPRTGVSLIEQNLREIYSETYSSPDKMGISKQHYTLDKLLYNNNINENNKFIFTFVRNPFDKIVSSYLNYTKK